MEKTESTPTVERGAHAKKVIDAIKCDLDHWDADFKRMKANRRFARGLQWPGMTRKDLEDPDRLYTENVALRHLKSRVASIYARNPKFIWRKAKRRYHTVWDGSASMLQAAMQAMQAPAVDPMTGQPAVNPMAQMVLQEAAQYAEIQRRLDGMGETLALAYEYSLREQSQPTKQMMKRMVMQAGTCFVGYVKQTFQRTMAMAPDTEQALNDARSQLATIQRLSDELSEGDRPYDDAEVDRLKSLIAQMEGAEKILLREGLALEYPDPLNIIPSKDCMFLPTFYGCTHVTEQYFLTPERVREVYGVDLDGRFTPYRPDTAESYEAATGAAQEMDRVRVWEMYHKGDGLVYVVADGHDDFLREPEAPFPWTERFWPWFAYAPNWCDDPDRPFGPSDVELIDTQQMEINRAGQGLRDHRYAARPGHVMGGAGPSEETKTRIEGRAAHGVVHLPDLPPEANVAQYLQPFPTSPIDPNLYNVGPAVQAILRATGTQEANLGPTSNATATESSIAQASRASTDDSSIDELDDLLTEMARAGGQILLLNMTEATVKEIVGPGAIWPAHDREAAAREIMLECEAGSSGRKNQAHEIQVRTQLWPILQALPGISHERVAKDTLNVMDSRVNWEDWLDAGALSITALNGQMQGIANRGDPAAQGPAGASNAPTPEAPGQQGPQPPDASPPPMAQV